MSRRVTRRVGEAKGQSEIGKQWISYPREMVESPALRVLSRAAILVMHRLEAEHLAHGGAENGRLIVTRRQFEDWGIYHDSVAPAIRELEALGFAEVSKGHAGVGGHGKANRFRLTYVNDKHGVEPTHEWQRVTTIEEAELIAAEARAQKDSRAQKLGERSASITRQKKNSVLVSREIDPANQDRKSSDEVLQTRTTMFRSCKQGPLSISRTGGGGGGDDGGIETEGTVTTTATASAPPMPPS
jgi:hypothetical protein